MRTSFQTLKRILSYTKKEIVLFIFSLLATLANVALTLPSPIILSIASPIKIGTYKVSATFASVARSENINKTISFLV